MEILINFVLHYIINFSISSSKKCQYSLSEFYCVTNTISVVIGSWIGAPVLLLDWDTGWKV